MMIVHEATHAIQDWQDVAAKNKYIEADAYIAGAVADLAQGGNVVAAQTGLIYPAATSAAKLVLAGRGNPADPRVGPLLQGPSSRASRSRTPTRRRTR